jgi:hypothetical protein
MVINDSAYLVGNNFGYATIGPGYSVPNGDPTLGEIVQQEATILPSLGQAAIEAGYSVPSGYAVQGGALGLIDPQDAWMTGRTYGLPGTATVQIAQNADGSYDSRMLGDVGIISNEIQRSIGYGGRYARQLGAAQPRLLGDASISDLFKMKNAGWMLGAIGAVVGLGVLGAIVTR